jgi:hypothetical protein
MAEKHLADRPLSVIAHFDVRRRAILAADGSLVGELPAIGADPPALAALYRARRWLFGNDHLVASWESDRIPRLRGDVEWPTAALSPHTLWWHPAGY